jgi:molybdopterin synthase sulfur carrier subunit
MMTIQLLFFGITQDLVDTHQMEINLDESISVASLKATIFQQFPNLKRFPNFEIAVNEQYATDDKMIHDRDIVAIIPPVSGG